MVFDIRTAVAETLANGGNTPAIAFRGRWRSWNWLKSFHDQLDAIVAVSGIAPNHAVALIGRNRPAHLAAMAAQTASGRLTTMIYSAQSPGKIAADIIKVSAPLVLGDPQDWTPETLAATRDAGAVAISIGDGEAPVVQVLGDSPVPAGSGFELRDPAIGFEMLSSGTTGAPKRIPLGWQTLSSASYDARTAYAGTGNRAAPQIMLHPIGNIAGVSYLLPIFAYGQQVVLLEKFDAQSWIGVVRDYRPTRASLPAAGVRMVLDSDATPENLSSLGVVVVGGGKLDTDLQIAFEERFGVPVLTAFGATEFAGVIANWTLDAYREFGAARRGSAGRASPNVELRIIDRESFKTLESGEIGLLEARVERVGTDWIRTNDLASLDTDGFLYIHGRADDAINRGGFKIVPDMVATSLKGHPAVADAAVVAKPDLRLGEVPVAAVELNPDAETTPDALIAFLRDRLVAYQIPTEIRIVDALPRNPSMKIALAEVKAMFAD